MIIFSFCLWGIGDIIKNYSASKSVISVNKASISSEFFAREYNQEKNRIRNSGQKPLSDEEMKKIDVKNIVIDKLLNESILEQAFESYKIVVPKKSLSQIIESIPEFQTDGTFNPDIYAKFIQRSGLSEAGFIDNIRKNLSKQQLIHPLASGYILPKFIKDMIIDDFNDPRDIVISEIKIDDMKLDEEIIEDDIKEYFNTNPEKYKIPENRNVSILMIDYTKLGENLNITDEEIDQYYNENKESYEPQEFRDFERYSFDDPESANKALSLLVRGSDSKQIVKKFMASYEEINMMDKSNFPDGLGDELFKIKNNGYSKVYNISGKYYIYKVIKIEHSEKKSIKEIRSEIKGELINEKMNSPEFTNKVRELNNQIDDLLGSGKNVDEVSKITKMSVVKLNGLTKNDTEQKQIKKIIEDDATRDEVLNSIFQTDENQAGNLIESRENDTKSYVVFIDKINKESMPKYEDIKDKVKKDVIDEQKNKIAREKISKIIDESKNTAKDISNMKGSKLFRISKKDLIFYAHEKNNKEISRILESIPNINVVLNIISSLNKNSGTYFKDKDRYILVGIKDIKKSQNIDPKFEEAINKHIDQTLSFDMTNLAIQAFRHNQKIKIDKKTIDEITKNSDEDENSDKN